MKISGYSEKIRLEVIKRGVECYERQVERDRTGSCPLYRPKGYESELRRRKKARTKSSWYKPYDTILFCPPTPNSELVKRLRRIISKQKEEGGLSIKVVEKAGIKVRDLLPGLKENKDCGREDCMIHKFGGKGDCNREGIVYKGKCLTCSEGGKEVIYIGESGRSGYIRGRQHLEAIRNHSNDRHMNNAFAKHIRESHVNQDAKFKMNIVQSYKKPLERQTREGVEIARCSADKMLNSRLDHYQPGIRRMTFQNLLE